ncbi:MULTISPECIES: hypothetical protein [Nostocales]|uniref:Uncharacterized protein n=2 Tax=Nostocales TaxID=1161 RepID=A0ABW8WIV3_9CYAN|nr:hypothetical protein [Tolypothrix bouteillei]
MQCLLLRVQAISISQHINYVIEMNQALCNRAAINFAVAFDDALGAGEDIVWLTYSAP